MKFNQNTHPHIKTEHAEILNIIAHEQKDFSLFNRLYKAASALVSGKPSNDQQLTVSKSETANVVTALVIDNSSGEFIQLDSNDNLNVGSFKVYTSSCKDTSSTGMRIFK